MRQISTGRARPLGRGDLRLHRRPPARLMHAHAPLDRHPRPTRHRRHAAARPDRAQARRHPRPAPARTLTRPPPPRPPPRDRQLVSRRLGRGLEDDLRPPPQPARVALGLVDHEPRGLQIVQPALHAAPMRTHEPRPLHPVARHPAPAHHRRQPRHQLPDRRRKPRRALRVPEPEQVALDRVRARLQPIITRRLTPARTTSPPEQRAHGQAARLGRQRLKRRPIPTTASRRASTTRCGCAIQRHRQRPQAPRQQAALRSRADARGTAGDDPERRDQAAQRARDPHPSRRGWRSVRHAATVGTDIQQGAPHGAICERAAERRPGPNPVFVVLTAVSRRPATPPRGTQSGTSARLRRSATSAVSGNCLTPACSQPRIAPARSDRPLEGSRPFAGSPADGRSRARTGDFLLVSCARATLAYSASSRNRCKSTTSPCSPEAGCPPLRPLDVSIRVSMPARSFARRRSSKCAR